MQSVILIQVLLLVVCISSTSAFQAFFFKKSSFMQHSLKQSNAVIESRGLLVNYAATDSEGSTEVKERDPALYVGNLPFETDEGAFSDIVKSELGNIPFKSIFYVKNPKNGKFRGYCYVNFESAAYVEEAVVKLKGLKFNERELNVDVSNPQAPKSRSQEDRPRERKPLPPKRFYDHTVYIGNLQEQVRKEEVMELCNEALGSGVAQQVRLAIDRETGQVRGYGHIDFLTAEDAARAVEFLNGRSLAGRTLRVNPAMRKDELPPSTKPAYKRAPAYDNTKAVFLGNLAYDVSSDLLHDMLSDILGPDTHTQIRLSIDKETGKTRGFAHVEFRSAEDAERAVNSLTGISLLDRPLKVDLASRKE